MARFLGAFILFGMAMALLKMVLIGIVIAIIGLIIYGLIFRTNETVGFLIVCGVFSFIGNYPWVSLGLLAAAGLVALIRSAGHSDQADEAEPLLLTSDTDKD